MGSKSLALDRIHKILDDGTFIEMQSFIAPSVIVGYGQVNGRLTYIFSEDKNAGAFDFLHAEKISRIETCAMKVGAPIIGIYDSKGSDVSGNLDTLDGFGSVFSMSSKLSGVVPQISIVMSDLIGSEAIAPMLSDFVFKIKGTSISMNAANVLGKKEVDNHTIGHFTCDDEAKLVASVKKLMSFMPQNFMEKNADTEITDDLNRKTKVTDDISELIKDIVDNGDILEVSKDYANNIKTYFARLGGISVGIVANDKKFDEGRLDISASNKASHFVRVCDAFNIPILTIVDTKGYKISSEEEKAGLVKEVPKLTYAYAEATVPMITLLVGEAYGNAYVSMASKHLGADTVYAYPDSKVGILTKEAAEKIYGDDTYEKNGLDIKNAAKKGFVDAIIEKADTRQILISTFDALATKYIDTIEKKHSNII